VEKQSRDVDGDLEAAEIPLEAKMWRQGPTAGMLRREPAAGDAPAAGYGGGGLGFASGGKCEAEPTK
jgi:hypothetical protein